MTEIALSGVYLAPASDLSDLLILNAGTNVSESGGAVGEVRRYAGGRTRLITRAGTAKGVQVSIARASRTTREQLAAWAGQTLLLRDGRGRLVYGAFLTLEVQEQPGLPVCDLSFTLEEITTFVVPTASLLILEI